MNLLANENFPATSPAMLRRLGHDVCSIGEDDPSISDEQVMQIAISTNRTILTFDRDYGELIFKHGYRPGAGVIYLRIEPLILSILPKSSNGSSTPPLFNSPMR